jgi:hypothetical protein
MEIEFLSALDYNVFVSEEQYRAWMSECDHLIAMDTRRKYRIKSIPTTPSIGKSFSGTVRSAAGRHAGKSTLPPLVHSMSHPILPSTTVNHTNTSLKRSASTFQPTPTKRMCLPNTPPPDDMLQYNILPPLVRSRVSAPASSTSQYYGCSLPQTPVYTPTLTIPGVNGCDPFITIPTVLSSNRYQTAPTQHSDSFATTKLAAQLPSWSSIALQPTPIYYRPRPTTSTSTTTTRPFVTCYVE